MNGCDPSEQGRDRLTPTARDGRQDAPGSAWPRMGRMLMGKKRTQRITVGVILGVMVVSLALSLITSATGP